MAVCHRCGRRLHPQAEEIVDGGGSARYCSSCAHALYARQQSPRVGRAVLFGMLAAVPGAAVGAFLLFLASEGVVVALLLILPGVSIFGYIIGVLVYLGSGRKQGRGLQWVSGVITTLALIASQVLIISGNLLSDGYRFFPARQAITLKTFIVHTPTLSEDMQRFFHAQPFSLEGLVIINLLLMACAIFFACKPVRPERLQVRNPEDHRLQAFQPSDTPPASDPINIPTTSPQYYADSAWGSVWSMLGIFVTLTVILSVLFPIFAKAREKPFNRSCNSNVRQLALALQMYAQDNGFQYPGIDGSSWVSKISPYLGSSASMFVCPEDYSTVSDGNSYAMSGLLIRPDGKGVKESQIVSPSEAGCLIDASPTVEYPNGLLVGGVPLGDEAANAEVVSRHAGGAIVGFCDGHAKYYQGAIDSRDLSSGVARALYQAIPLGLVDNPLACVPDFAVGRTIPDRVEIGGEFCTNALLRAAVEAWQVKAKAPWYTHGFTGQYAIGQRPANYLWGTGDGKKPAGNAIPIALDAVVVIVSKWTEITSLPAKRNSSYEVDYPTLQQLLGTGSVKDSVQVYTLGTNSGTRRFLADKLATDGKPLQFRKGAIPVANDLEMVEKVAHDPWGIGYCSSAFADPDRVVVLALKTPEGKAYYYPQKSEKHRWIVPNSPDWPWTRTLYAEYGGAAWQADGSGIANVLLAPSGAGTAALRRGPLFGTGLWEPE